MLVFIKRIGMDGFVPCAVAFRSYLGKNKQKNYE